MRRAAIALTVAAVVGLATNLAVAAPPHSGGYGHGGFAAAGHYGHGPGPGHHGRGSGHRGPSWGYGHGPSVYFGTVPRYRMAYPYPYYSGSYYGCPHYGYPYYGYPGPGFSYRGHGFGISIGF